MRGRRSLAYRLSEADPRSLAARLETFSPTADVVTARTLSAIGLDPAFTALLPEHVKEAALMCDATREVSSRETRGRNDFP